MKAVVATRLLILAVGMMLWSTSAFASGNEFAMRRRRNAKRGDRHEQTLTRDRRQRTEIGAVQPGSSNSVLPAASGSAPWRTAQGILPA